MLGRRPPLSPRWRAFSLIELLAVVAMVAVVLAMAAPQVSEAVRRERTRAARETIPAQLELILKEGRNRLLPIEFNVEADGIYYRYEPQAGIAMAIDACETLSGTSACRLRQAAMCGLFLPTDRGSVACRRMVGTTDTLLRLGDMDGVLALWPAHKRAAYPVRTLQTLFANPTFQVRRLSDPLIRFDTTFAERADSVAIFTITPLGRMLNEADRTGPVILRRLRYVDNFGTATVVEILDSGVVRVVP